MLKKFLFVSLVGSVALYAHDGANHESGGLYEYNAQVGLYYWQGYGTYQSTEGKERKRDFSTIFANVGFDGVEFEHLKFGTGLFGSAKLHGGKDADGLRTNANGVDLENGILYKLYVGYTSDFLDVSVGREEVDMDWLLYALQGARFAVKLDEAATTISGYYFDKQAVTKSPDEFDNKFNKVGPSFVVNVENNLYEPLVANLYFMNLNTSKSIPAEDNANFNALGFNLNLTLGSEESLLSDTIVRYTYFANKNPGKENIDANYLQVEENLGWNGLGFTLGLIKMIHSKTDDTNNPKSIPNIALLGDTNPLEQGEYVYEPNALTIYAGVGYDYNGLFNVGLLYGNTSGADNVYKKGSTKKTSVNEINLSAGFNWNGVELGFIYSKVMSQTEDSILKRGDSTPRNKKYNRDYVEAVVAYNF